MVHALRGRLKIKNIINHLKIKKMTLIKFKNPGIVGQYDRMPYISEMLNEFVNGWTAPDFRKMSTPAVNILETEKSLDIHLAAPGMKKEDFKIEVTNDVLTVSAEIKQENEEKSDRYTRKEFSYSSFSRSFNLPEFLNTDEIKASYENGVLQLVLPKKEEVKAKTAKEIKVS